jgi:hypothetical protein
MKLIALALVFGFIAAPGKIVNFDTDAIGKVPPGWTVVGVDGGAAAGWEVLKDQTAATQPYVLARLSGNPAATQPALAIFNSVSTRDGDVSVRVKSVAGSRARSGGVVFRYRDANNYYFAQADAAAQTVTLFKIHNGARIQMGHAARHALPANDWRILKVSARGNHIQVYLDHRRIIDAYDSVSSGPGKVGLLAGGDSVTYFDDFRVYPK